MARAGQSSFTSGELTPALHRRPTIEQFLTGLAKCYNTFVHPHGGASNRSGTQYIAEVKYSDKATNIISFAFNTQDTYAIELGDLYMRVVRNGGRVLLSSTPAAWSNAAVSYVVGDHVEQNSIYYYCYLAHTSSGTDEPGTSGGDPFWYALTADIVEIPMPYTEAELFDVKFVQSADVITMCHNNHPPAELSRYAHDKWVFTDIQFIPNIEAPQGVAASGGAGTSYNCVVTSVSAETAEESVASLSVSNLEDGGTITWTAVTGAESYAIYKESNGVYGFIGVAVGTSFTDTKFIPEFDDTPPLLRDHFTGAGNYPATTTYHEQRLSFANSINKPQNIWMSQTGNFHNMNVSSPAKADDAITLRIDAAQVNAVRNLVSLEDLIVLTSGATHKITSGDSPFAFVNLRTKPQSYRGSANIEAIVVDNTVLFIQARGSSVRDMAYALESDGYKGKNLSILAEHLVKYKTLVDWTFAQEPDSVIWMVRDDGILLGVTYMAEQAVLGWHWHQTDGKFEAICSISEGQEDAVYFIINRTINGVVKRYIERLHTRKIETVEDSFFVDCGLTYKGVSATIIDIILGTITEVYLDNTNIARRTQKFGIYVGTDWLVSNGSYGDLSAAVGYQAPDGSLDTITAFYPTQSVTWSLVQTITTTDHANGTFTFSCYMSKQFFIEQDVMLEIQDGVSVVAGMQSHTVVDHVNHTIPMVRYSVTGTFGASPAANIRIVVRLDAAFGSRNLYTWGMLLNRGSKAGTYIDGGSAGVDGNPFVVSDEIAFTDIVGTTEINGTHETISAEYDNLIGLSGLDSSAFTPYVSGGASKVVINSISGIDQLEGKSITMLCDGNVHPRKTVVNGAVNLDYYASYIHAGLPYVSDIKTLEPPLEGTLSKPKTAQDLNIGILNSRGMWAGPDENTLVELKQRSDEDWGDPTELFTGYVNMTIEPSWDNYGQIIIRQVDPLPMTILAVIPEYDVED